MTLDNSNYFSPEANLKYQSVSQIKSFCGFPMKDGCETAAMAELKGEYVKPVTDSLLIGSYVDAYFSNELDSFKKQHPEIFSSRGENKGKLKAQYQDADVMIERILKEELLKKYLTGDKQKIFTGKINGVDFKIKVDSIDGRRITDLKTCESIDKTYYIPAQKMNMNFIEAFDYLLQACAYQEIVRQNTGDKLPFYIVAVSKERSNGIAHPRVGLIQIPDEVIDAQMDRLKEDVERVQLLKDGTIEPIRCEKCDYCADTKVINKPISLYDLLS